MALRFFNAVSGRLETVRPAAGPVVDFLWRPPQAGLSARRQEVFVGALMDALVHLGWSLNQNTRPGENVDLYCSEQPLAPAPTCWLKPAPAGGDAAQGVDEDVWKLACLSVPYRTPLVVSAKLLEGAASDLERLRGQAARLTASHGTAEASSRGTAGYKKRLRDALAEDADFPAALEALWDGLRPGALSPGSQLGLLREAEAALGLALLLPGRS